MSDVDEVIDVEPEEEEVVHNLPAVRASEAIVARGELTVTEIVAPVTAVLLFTDV